jgi:ATP-dependent Lon protease, bacterial type
LVDNNDHYLLFKINKIEKKLPDINSDQFRQEINLNLKNEFKFNYNKKLIEDIQNKNLKYNDLKNFSKSKEIKKVNISSIRDNNKFSADSIKLIYSLPEKSFVLINDDENKIYLAFIKKIINENKITEEDLKNYSFKSNSEIRDTLYSSYDIYLSEKYEIKVFQNTIERLKNNFR